MVTLPGHGGAGAPRPASPTIASGTTTSHIAVVDAPSGARGVPIWVVAVVGFVALGLGFAAGYLVGG